MKKNPLLLLALLLLLAGVVLLAASAFIVRETQQAFVTQFGKPVGQPITDAGLHFKAPFVQKTHYFDKRFLEWDGHPNQVPTKDKRYISIDTYARWRIQDPLTFFQKVTDEDGAQTRLDDILDGATRNAIASHDLVEIVRSRHRTDRPAKTSEDKTETDELPEFEVGRNAIIQDILKSAGAQLEAWGIELLDIRFKRINYEEDVKEKIFDRMISERKRIAEKFRSEGEGEAAKIEGERERELRRIQSEAYRQAQEITGKADAEATTIYATAYNQSPETREFYQFLKTMETYENVFSETDWLILSTQSDFYRYLQRVEK